MDLTNDARSLMQTALDNYTDHYGLGSMSAAVYDTAWVAMVTKVVGGEKQWLFPECFEYILSSQSEEGGWWVGSDAQIDGILNTASALLALIRHQKQPLQIQHSTEALATRVRNATRSLRSQLATWDVSSTAHVGFEIIVPALLALLEQEDPSAVFEFSSKGELMAVQQKKMSRFRPEFLYGPRKFTALHSLEAFIGKLDFDKVKHHKVYGSMLGSPSSTAAYLMHASEWDEESEDYIRHVIKFAAGRGSGAVPSAFPSTHFEITWMLSTLIRGGFTYEDLESPELTKMLDILGRSFEIEKGVLGFAPFFEPDVDDTAKTISSLNMLGRPASPQSMIQAFETETHFCTYPGERDPSPTANCNALLALLDQPDVSLYSAEIQKLAHFLCDVWWNTDGRIADKWNTCYLYPSVLIVEAFVALLSLIEQDKLPGVFSAEFCSRLSVALFQACLRPLFDQQSDGSWNQSVEETAYGVLILSEARHVCFFNDIRQPLDNAIKRGVMFIQSAKETPASYIWIEKVSYASPVLTESYRLAALKATSSTPPPGTIGSSVWQSSLSSSTEQQAQQLFAKADLSRTHAEWELRGSAIETALLVPLLRDRLSAVLQGDGLHDEQFASLILLFWTSANNRERTFASAARVFETALLSALSFQLERAVKASPVPTFQDHMQQLRQLVDNAFSESPEIVGNSNAYASVLGETHATASRILADQAT
ncbi:Ent-kaur-16-ene synthase [Apiospora kogelbergensis]|uniref:Ent-kaur-16-ene synthase n=1 Tax=Apiospora kogelbergensis TaxID=1337665 RepID=UPI00312F48B3